MSQTHPLRKASSGAVLIDMNKAGILPAKPGDEVEASIATLAAIAGMMDRMQAKLDEQAATIALLTADVRDLTMHKEVAYGEMMKVEIALRIERDRADHVARLFEQAEKTEREATEKLSRLVGSVRDTFEQAERAAAATA